MTEREALKLALEALETLMLERGSIYDQAITAIREALAQPAAQCEYIRHTKEGTHWCALAEKPAAQWVGLTDEEVFDVWLNEMPAPDKVFYQKLCRSVEAKLKEKNT